jgi:hypothetical protein
VAHARPVFSPVPECDHLVVGEQRAVEQDDVGAREPIAQRGVTAAAPGTNVSVAPPAVISTPTFAPCFLRGLRRAALEIERHLAGTLNSSA